MVCPNCKENEATTHPILGILPCMDCQLVAQESPVPSKTQYEFTTTSIKQQRKDFFNDQVQPFRGGQPSKEYMELYPHRTKTWTPEMKKKAKNVWKSLKHPSVRDK